MGPTLKIMNGGCEMSKSPQSYKEWAEVYGPAKPTYHYTVVIKSRYPLGEDALNSDFYIERNGYDPDNDLPEFEDYHSEDHHKITVSAYTKEGDLLYIFRINNGAFKTIMDSANQRGRYVNAGGNDWYFETDKLQKMRSNHPNRDMVMSLHGRCNGQLFLTKPIMFSYDKHLHAYLKEMYSIPDDANWLISDEDEAINAGHEWEPTKAYIGDDYSKSRLIYEDIVSGNRKQPYKELEQP